MLMESEVHVASERFYSSLNRMAAGEVGAMNDIWSHNDDVTAMHPIGGRDIGWDAVRTSFDNVAGIASGGQIVLVDQVIQIVGDLAIEIGVEKGQLTLGGLQAKIEHRVTNIYRRESGAWTLLHHHTDQSSAMMDLLARLQANE